MPLQQHPDGLPADSRHEVPLYRLPGDQPHAPAGPPFRGRAADHGHDALRRPRAEGGLVPRPRFFVESPIEPLLDIAPANVAYRLRAHPQGTGHLRRTRALIQQAEHLGALDHPHRLNSAP